MINNADICLQDLFLRHQAKCDQLTEDNKILVSYEMMNCHYKRAGKQPMACDPNQNGIKHCTKQLETHYWHVFTQFYGLVVQYCQTQILQQLHNGLNDQLDYVKYQQHNIQQGLNQQQDTIKSIKLTHDELYQQNQRLYAFVDDQQNKLENKREQETTQQNELLGQLEQINQQIQQYHSSIKTSFDELYNYYGVLQYYISVAIEETQHIRTIIMYLAVLIILCFLTSNKQLYNQRFFCLITLLISLYLERMLNSSTQLRLVALLIITTKLYYTYLTFKDYEELTLQHLDIIDKQIRQLDTPSFRDRVQRALASAIREAKQQCD